MCIRDRYQHWARTVERFGIGETNDREWRCLEFVKSHQLLIVKAFMAKVDRKFAALCVLDSNVDTLANNRKGALLSKAEEVLGDRGRRFSLVSDLSDQRNNRSTQVLKQD